MTFYVLKTVVQKQFETMAKHRLFKTATPRAARANLPTPEIPTRAVA